MAAGSQVIIRGALINQISAYVSKNGQRCVEIDIHADWTDTVCEAMGWEQAPAGFNKASVGESLYANAIIMTPNKPALKDYAFELSANKADSFKYVPKHDKEGNPSGAELRFKVHTTSDGALITIDNWMKNVNDTDKGVCKVKYSEEKQQDLLDAPPETEEGGESKRGKKREAAAN